MVRILCTVTDIFIICMFIRIILSWFPLESGGIAAQAASVLYSVTEPVLGPIRRMLPPVGVGDMGFDLSPMIVLLLLNFLVKPLIGC